jgi:hypothetical protein
MKHVIILFLFLLSLPSFSQNPIIGIKGGVNWSNIFSKDFATDAYRTGCTFGLTYENHIKKNILVGLDLLYQQRGYQAYLMYTNEGGYPLNTDNTKFNSNYLAVPIKAGYTLGSKLSGFANIGIVPSVLIESKIILPDIFLVNSVDAKDQTKKFDLAGLAEIGGNLQLNKRILVSTSFAFQYSFTTFLKPEYDIDARHYSMILSGGIKYLLKAEESSFSL